MGCISSKVIARSISFHEERKQGSRRTVNGIPLLEDLINGSDQYLALVNKLHSRSLSSSRYPNLAIQPVASETVDKFDISARLGQEGGKQTESDKNKRSKSWHCFPEHIVSSLAQENLSSFEDKHNLSSKASVGSRSFHKVEEYDDMVNKIWLPKSSKVQQSEFNDEEDDGSGTIMDLQESELSNINYHTEDKDSAAKKTQPPCSHNQCSLEESKTVKEISSILSTAPESTIVTPSPNSHTSSSEIKNEEVSPSQKTNVLENAVQGLSTIEKGNKRKAIAKRLESLRIPSNVELPAIASLREWLPARGIDSSGTYITPKFGSYSQMDLGNENASSEDSVFSPELVSAFEQCMQKLEADEETILKQIIETVEEDSGGGMQPQERTPSSIQG